MEFEQHSYVETVEEDMSVRKRLISADGSVNIQGQAGPSLDGKVAGTGFLLEHGTPIEAHGGSAGTPGKDPKVKRRCQEVAGEELENDNDMNIGAASLAEDRQSQ